MSKEIRINRIILSDLPDLHNFKSFEGKDAFGIFSSGEVISAVTREADNLGIDLSVCTRTELPKKLSEALESDNQSIRTTASELVRDFGYRLGLIFYVLSRDPAVTIRANGWYSEDDFVLLNRMSKIYLVGGLANGRLGNAFARYAEYALRELGKTEISVSVGNFPSYSQLIGAARLCETDKNSALVFDFGHTFIKSAFTSFEKGEIKDLCLLPKAPAEYMGKGFATKEAEYHEAEKLHRYIVNVIVDAYSKVNGEVSSRVVVSIANNVIDGRIRNGGCYYKLMLLAENYAEYLSRSLTMALNREMHVTLVHDGRAASLCFEEEENAAAVALGTAFGVGYTKGRSDLLKVSNEFTVK